MAIEEITLSVPQAVPDADWQRPERTAFDAVNPDDRVVGRYRRILRDRNRFSWTRRGRQKRRETFEVAYRTLVKQLAKELTESIGDRSARLDTRTRIYASVTGILAVTTAEQQRCRRQSSKLFGWGLVLAGMGLTALGTTVYLTL